MALRLVLDTNVVLDLFHWQDRSAAPLLAAARDGRATFHTGAACFAEFAHVIARPEFGLDAATAQAAIDAYRALVSFAEPASRPARQLPRCRDPDDQKFLELARAAAADLLVSRDKALLALARRKFAIDDFRIVQPTQAVALLAVAQALQPAPHSAPVPAP